MVNKYEEKVGNVKVVEIIIIIGFRMMDITRAWENITQSLLQKPISDVLPNDLNDSLTAFHAYGMTGNIVREWFFDYVQRRFSSAVAGHFWREFQSQVPENSVVELLCTTIGRLYDEFETWLTLANRLEYIENCLLQMDEQQLSNSHQISDACQRLRDHLLLIVKATVFSGAPSHFVTAMHCFLNLAFRSYSNKCSYVPDESGTTSDDGCDLQLSCVGCKAEPENCCCEHTLAAFRQVVFWLNKLEVLERITSEPALVLVHDRIEQHVVTKCGGNFDKQYLSSLSEWLDRKVVSWLEELFQLGTENSKSGPMFPAHRDRLHYFLCETFGRIRIRQLFTIIVEFPESEPALIDLSECIDRVQELRKELVEALRSDLEVRLLHPGVDTNDILTAYVSAIRALRVLDPSGVLLDAVCDPVRKYLRHREDTVRCIVTDLTDRHSELAEELVRPQPLSVDEGSGTDSDDDVLIAISSISDNVIEHFTDWERWQPDPVDAATTSYSSTRHGGDIISMLVNIYGTRDLFVNEYRQLLAERLLTKFSFDTHRDVRHVELLKLRFGDSSLHNCEVMLKDISDSRRINARITEEKLDASTSLSSSTQHVPVNALIISEQFWPPQRLREADSPLVLPTPLREALDKFTRSFEVLKGNRTLNWKTHLGFVDIEIELSNGRTLKYKASPAHATIIWHFESHPRWTVKELASVAQMSAHDVRRRIAFWQSQRLLREEANDTFVLMEDEACGSNSGATSGLVMAVDDDEDACESAVAHARERREEELSVIWSYVVGMLTNLESLPLERIHSMLRMFAMQGPGSQVSQQDLRTFLDHKVKEQKLVFVSGVYRLPKHQ